jgi:hypothetical protein
MAIVNMDLLEYKYQLILTSLSEVPLGELYGVYGLSYSPSLSQTGELSFTVPKYFEDNGVRKLNVTYEDVSEDRLVLIDNQDYYYIDSCKETNENGIWKKEVHAFRREYELNSKRFGAYEPETERFLYFIHPKEGASAYPWTTIPTENRLHEFLTETKDADGYFWGIFNEIERLTTWRLERDGDGKPVIPNSLKTEVRMLSFSEENLLEVLNKIQEAWSILFEYDTINRVIKIRTQEMFEDTPNGVLSDESFITTLSREIKGSEIKTRLFLYNLNGDGVTAERMAHGQPYIEDYSYYINNGYLTPHLVSALNTYTTTLNTLQTQTFSKWTELKSYYEEYKQTQTKIDQWEQELIGPLSTYDYYETIKKGFIIDKGLPTEQVIAQPRPLTPEEQASQNAAKTQITALERNIGLYTTGTVSTSPRSLSQLDTLIKAKKNELVALQNTSLMSNVFTNYENTNSLVPGSLLKEMEPFIRDAVFQSDSIEDSDDLYTEGLKILSQVSKPRIQFEMALIDFLSMVEFDHAWSLATLGQILRIESKDTGFIDNIMLLRYTHNPDEKSLTFEFSNDLKINNSTTFLAELISKSSTTASQVSFNANYWAQGGSTGSSGPGGNIFDNLYANYIQTNKLVAGEIEAERIQTTELIANAIEAETIRTESLYAKTAEVDSLVAGSIVSGSLTTGQLDARYAEIDLGNINTGVINTVLSQDLLATDGFINNLKVTSAQMVSIDAAKITTGTLSAERILITGSDPNNPNSKPLLLTLNNLGELVSESADSLDGYILTNNTVHANKIIAESITAREIATGAITADKILAGSITSASGLIADLDAGDITTGTLDASKVAITNLSANSITAGELRSLNDIFYLDMMTGYFNIGNAITYNENGVQINLGGMPAEDYIADRMPHQIYSFPSQIMLNTSAEGRVEATQSFEIEIPVYEGGQLKAAVINGVYLKNNAGQNIVSTDFSSSVINPTSSAAGKLTVNFLNGFNPNTNGGTINMTITVGARQYFYSVGWAKNKKLPDNYQVQILSTQGDSFKNGNISTTLLAVVYKDSQEYDSDGLILNYTWTRDSGNPVADSTWAAGKVGAGNSIGITSADLINSATFFCEVSL